MMPKLKVTALVPMRHHSQRVPGKNYRLLAGKPLYHHILESLGKVPEIERIAVDTDSPEVVKGLKEFFPEITIIERPEHLKADNIPMNEVLMYDVSQVPGDLYIQTHSTNPLLKPETISKAINQLLDLYPSYDSMFSVTRLQTRLWDELTRPINHNPAILLQTQDLPPVYLENSCFYLFNPENLKVKRNRLGDRPLMFEVDRSEAYDIDEEVDFLMADLLKRYQLNQTGI
jgi:CMP-N-acetylneuraminic acid synthetase